MEEKGMYGPKHTRKLGFTALTLEPWYEERMTEESKGAQGMGVRVGLKATPIAGELSKPGSDYISHVRDLGFYPETFGKPAKRNKAGLYCRIYAWDCSHCRR